MSESDDRRRDVGGKLAVVSVPLALVGLLSYLPAQFTTNYGVVEPKLATNGGILVSQGSVPTGDLTAPVIDVSSLSVSRKEATVGDKLTFSMHVTDEVGVHSCYMRLVNPETDKTLSVSMELVSEDPRDGMWTGSIEVEESTPPGEWQVDYVDAFDANDNGVTIYDSRYTTHTDSVEDLSKVDFKVVGTTADVTDPVIDHNSLSVSPKEVTIDNPPTFSIHVTDDVGVNSCSVGLVHTESKKRYTVFLELESGDPRDGTWTGTMKVKESTPPGEWRVSYVTARDASDNHTNIYDPRDSSWYSQEDLSKADFKVVGTTGDVTDPVIDMNFMSVSPRVASVDDPPTFSIRVTDDEGVEYCYVGLVHPETEKRKSVSLRLESGDSRDGTWTGSMEVDDSMPPGEWQVDYVTAYDANDNTCDLDDPRNGKLVWDSKNQRYKLAKDDLSGIDVVIVPDECALVTYADGCGGECFSNRYTLASLGDPTPEYDGDEPKREGFIFTGWSPVISQTVTENVVYTASWKADEGATHTVTYTDGCGGASFSDAIYYVREGDPTPEFKLCPSRKGYTFAGWNKEPEGTVTADTVYTAQWETKIDYTVSLGDTKNIMIRKQQLESLDGQVFWQVTGDGNGEIHEPRSDVDASGDTILSAVFEATREGLVTLSVYEQDSGRCIGTCIVLVTPGKPKVSELSMDLIDDEDGSYVYAPGGVTPKVKVCEGDKVLTEGTDYTLSYENNKNVGKASVIVKGIGEYGGKKSLPFTITQASLSSAKMSEVETQEYRGQRVTPPVTVTYEDTKLVEDTDYTLSYANCDGAGTGRVIATGIGNYTGSVSTSFDIVAVLGFDDAEISVEPESFVYDGESHMPDVILTLGDDTLVKDKDYEVEGDRGIDKGTYYLTVRGLGDYAGQERECSFEVEPAIIGSAEINVASQTYTGKALTPKPTVTFKGRTLKENTDYTLSYNDNVHPGLGQVRIQGKGNFRDAVTLEFEIVEMSGLDEADLVVEPESFDYDGKSHMPKLTLTLGDDTLIEGEDYEIVGDPGTDAGTYDLTVRGIGDYAGQERKCSFKVTPADISLAEANAADQIYTGEELTPKTTVTFKGRTLREGTDYKVSYSNNVECGVANITIEGKGNFEGTLDTIFHIEDENVTDISEATVTVSSGSYVYDGTEKRPAITVMLGQVVLNEGSDYALQYTDNVNAGTATVVVYGIEDHVGEARGEFDIEPREAYVIANEASKEMGENDPKLTATVKNLVDGDTLSYRLSRAEGEQPGTYAIEATGDKRQGNYVVSYTGSTFTIVDSGIADPMQIADIASRTYRASQIKPSVTVTCGDATLVEGRDYQVSYGDNLHVGQGTVDVTGIGRYDRKYASCTFEILPKSASVTVESARKTEGDKDPKLSYTISGLAGSDRLSGATITRDTGETAGTYTIRVSDVTIESATGEDVTADYDISCRTGTLVIESAGKADPDPTPTPDPTPSDKPDNQTDSDSDTASTSSATSSPRRWFWPQLWDGNWFNPFGLGWSRPTWTEPTRSESSSSDTSSSETKTNAGSTRMNAGTATKSAAKRLAGKTRYDTMSEAVSAGFDKSDWVIVASGENFPDALSAIALAGSYNAPVVLTSAGELSGQAAAQLRRLSASHVIIVGGDSAVSSRVEKQIADIVGDVTRVSGTDRAQTSVRVMERLRPGRKGSDTVIIASGTSFADALSAGPWAWKTSTPIILAGSDGRLSSEAVNAIKRRGDISRVLFVGGESVVSDAIKNQLGDGYTYVRKGGADRYETSALMAEFSCENGLDWHAPVVATGTDFADALAGAPLAGKVGSPLLLVDKSGGKAADAVARNAKSVRQVYVLGGESAVPDAAEKALTRSLS